MKKTLGFSSLLLAVILTVGCGDDKKKDVSLSISPATSVIMAGDSVLLNVTAENTEILLPEGAPGTITQIGRYALNFTASERVEGATTPKLLNPGEYTITVTAKSDKSKKASATVIVTSKLSIDPATPSPVEQEATQQFAAVIAPAADATIAWTLSSDGEESIGTIDQNGLFTAAAAPVVGTGKVSASFTDPVTGKLVSASVNVSVIEPSQIFAWTKTFPMTPYLMPLATVGSRPWLKGDKVVAEIAEINMGTFLTTYLQATVKTDGSTDATVTTNANRMDNPDWVPGPTDMGMYDLLANAVKNDSVAMGIVSSSGVAALQKWPIAGGAKTGNVAVGELPQSAVKVVLSQDKSTFFLGYTNATGKLTIEVIDPADLSHDTAALTLSDGLNSWLGEKKPQFADMIYDDADNFVVLGTVTDTTAAPPVSSGIAFGKTAGKEWRAEIPEISGLASFSLYYVIRDADDSLIVTGTGTTAAMATVGFIAKPVNTDFSEDD